MVKCPGQDQRFWKPEDIFEMKCPGCGGSVEFFKDEPKLKCRHCGKMVDNPRIDLGCAEWCPYGDQCLGITPEGQANIMRDKLIWEMKKVFEGDNKRIEHALAVLKYAEQILGEQEAEPLVVTAAAILHDIGIHEAERKHGSSAGKYQEIEGPPIAKKILKSNGVDETAIEHICRIVGSHHSAKDIDTPEFRCIWDADWLVNLPEVIQDKSKEQLDKIIEGTFKTAKGLEMAKALFINGNKN